MALVTALAARFRWNNWFLNIALFLVVYFLVVYRYRRSANKGEDEYYKVAGLGKYASAYREENT